MKKIALAIGAVSLLSISNAQADQVILDDLIVDGSACIGFDCVNGESFGFDTIRIKENNLRIKAVDTSSTVSFPTNDWQITFNDSANGGQNKFSIDDIDGGRTPFTIEAGAPSHSLYVDDGGRVGFGTSTPVVDLHVKSGNTPTTRLEQDGSSGFTPQTWDVAGNEANFFIRDATNGSTLPFRIQPGAPSNSIFVKAGGGYVGLGTSSPITRLHVVGDAPGTDAVEEVFRVQSPTAPQQVFKNNGTGNQWFFAMTATDDFKVSLDGTGKIEAKFFQNGNLQIAGTLIQLSDRASKQDIVEVNSKKVLDAVVAMPISTWEYKADEGVAHMGPMAQDFHAAFGLGDTPKGISTIDTGGVALAAIKGLNEVVQSKDSEIESLRSELAANKAELASNKSELAELKELVHALVAKDKVAMNQ